MSLRTPVGCVTASSHALREARAQIEPLEHRRLLSAVDPTLGGWGGKGGDGDCGCGRPSLEFDGGVPVTVEMDGPGVVEYDPVTGEQRFVPYAGPGSGAADDLAWLNAYLAANGFTDVSDLLWSLQQRDGGPGGLGGGGEPGGLPRGGGESVAPGGSTPGYDPTGLGATYGHDNGVGGTRSVQPPDDRRRVIDTELYPFRAVGRLNMGCSGAMISPFHFLTAGHCVTSGGNFRPLSQLGVSLARDGSVFPFGTANATFVRTYSEWINGGNWNHDWALVTLDRSVGQFAGWLGYRWYPGTSTLDGWPAHIAQYPGDKPTGTQWLASGEIAYGTDLKIFYKDTMDTAGGSSGSSVYEIDFDEDMPYSLGVHGYGGANAAGTGYNSGARIDQRKFDDLNDWVAIDLVVRPPVDMADLLNYDSVYGTSTSGFSPFTNPGGPFNVNMVVRNGGTAPAEGFRVSFYASTHPYLSTTRDLLLTTTWVDATLMPFEDVLVNISGNLPESMPHGDWYIGYHIDPGDQIDEFNTVNNVGRMPGTMKVGNGGSFALLPDRFEPNNTFGGAYHLGSVHHRFEPSLNIHDGSDRDFFRFTAAQSGQVRVEILFTHAFGDIDARIRSSTGTTITSGTSGSNNEIMTFNAVAGTDYVIEIWGYQGATNRYDLRIIGPGGLPAGGPVTTAGDFEFEFAHDLVFNFSQPLRHLLPTDLMIFDDDGRRLDPADYTLTLAPDGLSAGWRYTAGNGILPDGRYSALLPAGVATNLAGNRLGSDQHFEFFFLQADPTRDGEVTLADVLRVRSNFGQSGVGFSGGDVNYDGVVDLADLLIVRGKFGYVLPGGGGEGGVRGLFGDGPIIGGSRGDDGDEGGGGRDGLRLLLA